MRRHTKTTFGLLALCLLSLAGCQKLNYEKNFTLGVGEVQGFPVDAPRSQQKVSATVTATGSPVNVYIVLEDDHSAVMEALSGEKKPDAAKILASKEKMDSGSVEATIPAKKGFSVLICGANKNTEIKLKITGK